MASPTIAAPALYRLLQAAVAAGIDPARLPPIEIRSGTAMIETRLPYETFLGLWEAVMREVRDPGFPIRHAERITSSDFDLVGFACMTRATLGEAIQQAARFARVWSDVGGWQYRQDDRLATLELSLDDAERFAVRCGSESFIAEMIQGGRLLTGVCYVPEVVRFRHARPLDTTCHERFFGGAIEWGAERTEIVIDRELLALPLLRAEPALAAFFEAQASELLARLASAESTVRHKLREVLATELRGGVPALETVAPRMAMSPRTLRRRLHDEGTSYHQVLEELRRELAKRYLAEPGVPVGAVGFLLGFSEPSAFHRAFKRWTGSTPLGYRRAAGVTV